MLKWIFPGIEKRQLFYRPTGNWPVAAQHRIADRDRCGGAPGRGNRKQRGDFRLGCAEQGRKHATESLGAASEEQVLDGGINRPATDHRDAGQVRIGDGHLGGIEAKNRNDRALTERTAQVGARTEHPFHAIARGHFQCVKAGAVSGGERRPLVRVERAQPFLENGILDYEYPPRLAVAARRAQVAASMTRCRTSSGTGSGRSLRTARNVLIAS